MSRREGQVAIMTTAAAASGGRRERHEQKVKSSTSPNLGSSMQPMDGDGGGREVSRFDSGSPPTPWGLKGGGSEYHLDETSEEGRTGRHQRRKRRPADLWPSRTIGGLPAMTPSFDPTGELLSSIGDVSPRYEKMRGTPRRHATAVGGVMASDAARGDLSFPQSTSALHGSLPHAPGSAYTFARGSGIYDSFIPRRGSLVATGSQVQSPGRRRAPAVLGEPPGAAPAPFTEDFYPAPFSTALEADRGHTRRKEDDPAISRGASQDRPQQPPQRAAHLPHRSGGGPPTSRAPPSPAAASPIGADTYGVQSYVSSELPTPPPTFENLQTSFIGPSSSVDNISVPHLGDVPHPDGSAPAELAASPEGQGSLQSHDAEVVGPSSNPLDELTPPGITYHAHALPPPAVSPKEADSNRNSVVVVGFDGLLIPILKLPHQHPQMPSASSSTTAPPPLLHNAEETLSRDVATGGRRPTHEKCYQSPTAPEPPADPHSVTASSAIAPPPNVHLLRQVLEGAPSDMAIPRGATERQTAGAGLAGAAAGPLDRRASTTTTTIMRTGSLDPWMSMQSSLTEGGTSPPAYMRQSGPVFGPAPPAEASPVLLRVYDFSHGMVAKWSRLLLGEAIEGIWHSGIQIFNHLYHYFGGGVFKSLPEKFDEFEGIEPVMIHHMGYTTASKEDFLLFLSEIIGRFKEDVYDILDWNCNHFSQTLCRFLVQRDLPLYITDAPKQVVRSRLGRLIVRVVREMGAGDLNGWQVFTIMSSTSSSSNSSFGKADNPLADGTESGVAYDGEDDGGSTPTTAEGDIASSSARRQFDRDEDADSYNDCDDDDDDDDNDGARDNYGERFRRAGRRRRHPRYRCSASMLGTVSESASHYSSRSSAVRDAGGEGRGGASPSGDASRRVESITGSSPRRDVRFVSSNEGSCRLATLSGRETSQSDTDGDDAEVSCGGLLGGTFCFGICDPVMAEEAENLEVLDNLDDGKRGRGMSEESDDEIVDDNDDDEEEERGLAFGAMGCGGDYSDDEQLEKLEVGGAATGGAMESEIASKAEAKHHPSRNIARQRDAKKDSTKRLGSYKHVASADAPTVTPWEMPMREGSTIEQTQIKWRRRPRRHVRPPQVRSVISTSVDGGDYLTGGTVVVGGGWSKVTRFKGSTSWLWKLRR